MTAREHDIVLYGATGFVGALIAGYLAEHAPLDVRIGLAGRSEAKLRALRDTLGPVGREWPLLIADTNDPAAIARIAASTEVLATSVGPYLRYGLPVARACAAAGTHYLDLSGENLFVRACIDELDVVASHAGARLVNSCGFDSIPSDLGVFALAERVRADGEGELGDTTLVVRSARGGISGGTIDSLRAQTEATAADRSTRRVVADPYGLSPDRSLDPAGHDERDRFGIHHDPELGWTGPFVMASYNTRIVRRSNALLDYAYGRSFRYREVMGFGNRLTSPLLAAAVTGGLGLFAAAMSKAPIRRVLDRVLPKPGAGPSEKTRRTGRFRMDVVATTTTGARYRSTVAAKGDPGYAATSVMFAEAALSLALDADRLPARYGVLTPAVALGDALIDRLRGAGMTLAVDRIG